MSIGQSLPLPSLRRLETVILHPYSKRLLIFSMFFILFLWLYQFIPFYPITYSLILSFGIAAFAMKFQSWALISGLIFSIPSMLWQNPTFTALYSIFVLVLLYISLKDWRIAYSILFSFLIAFSPLLFLSPLVVLLTGFHLTERNGAVTGLVSSSLITVFALGLGTGNAGLMVFPINTEPFLYPWFSPPVSFTFSTLYTIPVDHARPISSIIGLFSQNPFLLVEIVAMSSGGYLAGNVLTWRLNRKERLAIIIGAIPITVGFVTSSIASGLSYYNNMVIMFLSLFSTVLTSLSSVYWRPLVSIIGTLPLVDLRVMLESKENEIKILRQEITKRQEESILALESKQGTIDLLNNKVRELEGDIRRFQEQFAMSLPKPEQFESLLTTFQKTILWHIFNGVNTLNDLAEKLRVSAASLTQYLQIVEKLKLIETRNEKVFLTDIGYETALKTPEDIKKFVPQLPIPPERAIEVIPPEVQKKNEIISQLQSRIRELESGGAKVSLERPAYQPTQIKVEQKQTSGWQVCGYACLILVIVFVILLAAGVIKLYQWFPWLRP